MPLLEKECFIYYIQKTNKKIMYNLFVNSILKKNLFNLLLKALTKKNYILKKYTDRNKIIDFFQLIKPIVTEEGLVRFGSANDGGYLIPNNLNDIKYCFSPGVSDNYSFEVDLYDKKGIVSFLADYTVEDTFDDFEYINFEKKFLGTKNSSKTIRLDNWVNEKVNDNSELILQMDIENSEWEILTDTSIELLDRFKIMVIEFHNFGDYLINSSSFFFVNNLFKKILNKFDVVHIHPNNCCGVIEYGDISIPNVIEISFLNSRYSNSTDKKLIFPHKLDSKNLQEKEDIILNPIWDLN